MLMSSNSNILLLKSIFCISDIFFYFLLWDKIDIIIIIVTMFCLLGLKQLLFALYVVMDVSRLFMQNKINRM